MTTTNDGRIPLDFLGTVGKRDEVEEGEGKGALEEKQRGEAASEATAGDGERAKVPSGGSIRDSFNLFSSYFRERGKEKEGSAGGRPSMEQLGWFLKHHNPLTTGPTATATQANRSTAAQQNGDRPQQLTIFYGGTVNVFDDIPSEKVQAIMMLAAVSAANAMKNAEEPNASEGTARPLSRSPSLHSTSNQALHPSKLPNPTTKVVPPLCKSQSDLPIARRNSFQRFLEKRRDSRLASKAPYPDATKEGNDKAFGGDEQATNGLLPGDARNGST
ncbi:protein TIFY 3B-like isoform X1 [Nymphaea colorata]|nr:protein TIFY 3B-like isoform X1 [Nymphaea colorata]